MNQAQLNRSLYKRQSMKCGECGHIRWKTPHKLSGVHARGLIQCAEAYRRLGRPVTRDDMDLERNENGNFAALRWWKLIEAHPGNAWSVTEDGWAFLRHEKWVDSHVWTIDGERVAGDPNRISIRSVLSEEAWQRAEYIARRVPVVERGALVI